MRSKKWLVGTLALLLVSMLFLTACGSSNKQQLIKDPATGFTPFDTSNTKVIATYNGGKITEGDVNLFINVYAFFQPTFAQMFADPSMKSKLGEAKKELAKQLAGEIYIANKVKDDPKYGQETDKTLKDIESQLKSTPPSTGGQPPANLDEAIKGRGFTKDQLRTFILRDQKVKAFYDEQLKTMQYDDVKVTHILIAVNDQRKDADALKLAQQVKQKLDAGGDFAALAKQYSDDPGSKDNGGLIEGPADMFVPEFANAAKTLPFNKISDPVKTQFGYHIIKVLDRSKKSYDQAPDDLKQQKQQEIFENITNAELGFKLA